MSGFDFAAGERGDEDNNTAIRDSDWSLCETFHLPLQQKASKNKYHVYIIPKAA